MNIKLNSLVRKVVYKEGTIIFPVPSHFILTSVWGLYLCFQLNILGKFVFMEIHLHFYDGTQVTGYIGLCLHFLKFIFFIIGNEILSENNIFL